ncbi:hypothetical protein TrLO_g8214 [Triparma laevis f. longispina]|uniref:Uncharacterized protein n=1 Tax=Triparma laevis f. longispina TaxID=1714387 RepID=A0A9W6Z5I0_9STRA|nr:hypothetical protein TrLO_g8214 [Triparma laevis f. longispina]
MFDSPKLENFRRPKDKNEENEEDSDIDGEVEDLENCFRKTSVEGDVFREVTEDLGEMMQTEKDGVIEK